MLRDKISSISKKIGDKCFEMADKIEDHMAEDKREEIFESKVKESLENGDKKYTAVKKLIESEESSIEFDKLMERSKANPEYNKAQKTFHKLVLINFPLFLSVIGLFIYSLTFMASGDMMKFIMVSAIGMLTMFVSHGLRIKTDKVKEEINKLEKEPFTFSDDIKAKEENLNVMKEKLAVLVQNTIVEENINVSKEMREVRENIESFKKTSKIVDFIVKVLFFIPTFYGFCNQDYKMVAINAVAYLVIGFIIFIYTDSQVSKMEKELKELEQQYH